MVVYACRTRDASGKIVEKTVDAASRSLAISLLEKGGLFPVKITEMNKPVAVPARSEPAATPSPQGVTGRRTNRKELQRFSLQLSSSLSAGVPLLTGLRSVAKQTDNRDFRAVLMAMVLDIQGGLSLSGAMQKYKRAFPSVYVRTVAAGEQSGTVDVMLNNLADFLEAEMEVIADVRTALLYPAIVVSTLCVAISVLILFVVPRFTEFYSRFGAKLPLPTRILILGSQILAHQGIWIALGLAGLVTGSVRVLRSPGGRHWLDRTVLRVPIFGRLIETAITLRIVQILGLSTQAGLPMLECLELIVRTTANSKIVGDLRRVAEGIRSGETLTKSMEEAGCFPPSARQMLASGETSGSLERACFAVGKHYRKELHYLTKNLATLIEPLLTLALAGVVLFVALAVFLPMWNLVKVVQQ